MGRFVDLGSPDIVRECEAAYEELLALEQEEIRKAVSGDGYDVVWERGRGPGGLPLEGQEPDAGKE